MFCQKCGCKNSDGASFCSHCGAPINAQKTQFQYQHNVNFQTSAPRVPGKGMGIAAMVLGITACVLCCYIYFALPCAIVGLVLGILSRSKAKKAGLKNVCAIAGIACSAVALGLSILFVVYVIIIGAYLFSSLYEIFDYNYNDFYDYYYSIANVFNSVFR